MSKACEKRTVPRKNTLEPPPGRLAAGPRFADQNLTPQEAVEEAKRCLVAQGCQSCEVCGLLCPDLCITRDEATGRVVIDLDYCKGCGICAAVCPKHAIVMKKEE